MSDKPTTDDWQGGGIDRRNHPEKVKQLQAQLAAEREKVAVVERSRNAEQAQVVWLTEQLAAERQDREERAELAQVTTLPSAAQLTWGKVLQEEIEQLKEQLAVAVDALKEMRGYDADRVDRWLAKVEKEGFENDRKT